MPRVTHAAIWEPFSPIGWKKRAAKTSAVAWAKMKKSYHSMVVPTTVPAMTLRSSRRSRAGTGAAGDATVWLMGAPGMRGGGRP